MEKTNQNKDRGSLAYICNFLKGEISDSKEWIEKFNAFELKWFKSQEKMVLDIRQKEFDSFCK